MRLLTTTPRVLQAAAEALPVDGAVFGGAAADFGGFHLKTSLRQPGSNAARNTRRLLACNYVWEGAEI